MLRHELSLQEMPGRPYMAFMISTRVWRRLPIIRTLVHRPRLALCMAVAAISWPALLWLWPNHVVAEILLSYNLGTTLYLVLAGHMMLSSNVHNMRWRARLQDEGRTAVLMGVVVASVISLVAIAAQLSIAKDAVGITKILHIVLSAFTVLTSWSFTQTMFALHYAHSYYGPSSDSAGHGLDFPGTTTPDYLDFLYVACVIGTSGQTADVSFSSSAMRRIGLLHSVLSFFYNATMVALTINILASLL